MKKFLSLALALLMMLPLAIGTSAAHYKDLISHMYGSNGLSPYLRQYCETCETYTKWEPGVDSDGKVYLDCSKCSDDYKYYTGQVIKYENKKACSKCNCYDCNKYAQVCDCCDKCDVVDGDMMVYPEYDWTDKFYHNTRCDLDDLTFYPATGGFVWVCDCNKTGYISYSDWDEDWDDDWNDYFWDYDITVSCGRGGDYSIDGRHVANYGDTRTITFDPDYGYVLYDVTVNGVSYGAETKLELTVTKDLHVRATFVKASTLKPCTFTTTVFGNGEIKALKNSKVVTTDKFTACYGDTVSFKFIGANDNYVVKNVVINGVSKGAIKSYSINTKITKDVDIKVTFEWKSPYSDVSDNYLNAVEYVTEAGIMGYYNKYVNKNAFGGTKEISVKSLAAALAEMADVNEKLDTVDERIEWATKNGIIAADANLSALCKVQDACEIVNAFLAVLEDEGDLDFEDFDDDDTAKENALSIGLVSEKTYKSNRNLTRYDLASICYLIVNLDVE